jgi:SHS2 domain-containing protein
MNSSAEMKPAGFEEVEHTADWAYRVWGESLPELFSQAAWGLYELAGTQLASSPRIEREIHLRGVDSESLLIAWLNELLNLHESENLVCDGIEIIQLDRQNLHAKITGAPTQEWIKDIKAATYHNLAIRPTETGFEVTIVLDV